MAESVWLADAERVMLVLAGSDCVVEEDKVLVAESVRVFDTDVETVMLALDVPVWVED